MTKTLIELTTNGACEERAKAWRKEPETVDAVQLLKDIIEIGKGRYAQRLASKYAEQDLPTVHHECTRRNARPWTVRASKLFQLLPNLFHIQSRG